VAVDITECMRDADSVIPTRHVVAESRSSDLLKSTRPVTCQPDWSSIAIENRGATRDREGLLQYLIYYREQADFHEQCVESIFMDIWNHCKPEALTDYARYLRRGGLDINPWRSSQAGQPDNLRLSRQ